PQALFRGAHCSKRLGAPLSPACFLDNTGVESRVGGHRTQPFIQPYQSESGEVTRRRPPQGLVVTILAVPRGVQRASSVRLSSSEHISSACSMFSAEISSMVSASRATNSVRLT